MGNADDFYVFTTHAIGNDVVLVHHQFACAYDTAGAADRQKLNEGRGLLSDFLDDPLCALRAVLGNVVSDKAKIPERCFPP